VTFRQRSISVASAALESPASLLQYSLGQRGDIRGKSIVKSGQRFHRMIRKFSDDTLEVMADYFDNNIRCEFIRLTVLEENHLLLNFPEEYDVMTPVRDGWLFRSRDRNKCHYWLPLPPAVRNYDTFGRITGQETLSMVMDPVISNKSCALFVIPEDYNVCEFILWNLPSESSLYEEIVSPLPQEQQGIYLWSSHSRYTGLRDVYYNLVHGACYKVSSRWSHRQCIASFSETYAYSLYVACHGLWKSTGKRIYKLLKKQLIFSVIARQERTGAWRHGSLTDEFEEDYRHACSAIHMLAAYYDETKDNVTSSSLKRAVDYLKHQHDRLNVGTWYLHDSLELSEESMQKSPVAYQHSRALGKSPSNMLVLNTHLDALVAFSRYQEVTGESCLEDEIASGVNAAVAVLGLAPAELFYRVLFRALELTFLPDSTAITLPLMVRAIRRVARNKLIPLIPWIKKIFPRLVMPNGYIDRNLTLNEFWHPYFLINIMDLLRFQMRFNIQKVEPVIHRAFAFVERVGLEKWLKDEETAYAVAFLAEALYLDCLRRPDRSRAALADTALALEDSGLGIPPSLLGCNTEYIRLADQVPCIWTGSDQLRVINLSVDSDHLEFLIINSTDMQKDISLHRLDKKLMAFDQDGNPLSAAEHVTVANRGWVQLLSFELQGKE
jgi:hypothetical protein